MQNVQKDHEWLQNTQAELEAETEEMLQVSTRLNDNFVKAIKLMWRQLFVIWAVVIILFIGSFFVVRSLLFTSQPAGVKPSPATKPASVSEVAVALQTPAASSPDLNPEWGKVEEILRRVQEAQLNKDINQLLAAYSPSFPDLEDKKTRILQSWERYNYLDLRFILENVSQQNDHSIMAKVVWMLVLEDRQSQEKTNLIKKYTIFLANESGKWRIQNLFQERAPKLARKMED